MRIGDRFIFKEREACCDYAVWLSLVIALMRVESPLPPRRLALIVVAIIRLPGAAPARGLLAPPHADVRTGSAGPAQYCLVKDIAYYG